MAAIESTGSVACVGLDPRPDLIPPTIVADARKEIHDRVSQVAYAFARFNHGLLDALVGVCPAVKPQVACYEAYGASGWRVLESTVRRAKELGFVVIIDGKRGDIGSTAVHYHQGLLTSAPDFNGFAIPGLGGDWVTASPYLGGDSVLPLVGSPSEEKGAFVLVKTSNPGSGDLQDRPSDDGTVAQQVARLVDRWGADRRGRSGFSDIGAVVGATYPDDARSLRQLMPHTLFLVPGYGAQGASASDALAGRTDDGGGVLVSASRSIISAWKLAGGADGAEYAAAARGALDDMNAALNALRD